MISDTKKKRVPKVVDIDTARESIVLELSKMTKKQLFATFVSAGIFTPEGKLTAPYRTAR